MADISQITVPSGNTYDIKDTVARTGISSGGTFVIAWAGGAAPTVADIPAGVVVTYNNTNYTGTRVASADDQKKFFLVAATNQGTDQETLDIYDEYVVIDNGTSANPRYSWEKIGDTQIKLTAMVTNVTLNKQTTDFVTSISNPDKDTFLKKVTANTSKLATTTITGVSGSTTASKVSEGTSQTTAKGTGTASTSTDAWLKGWSVSGEVLTIGGVTMDTQTTTQVNIDTASVTVPQAASNATRVATGALDATDTHGSSIATGVTISGTGYTADALTSLGTQNKSAGLNNSTSITVSHPS